MMEGVWKVGCGPWKNDTVIPSRPIQEWDFHRRPGTPGICLKFIENVKFSVFSQRIYEDMLRRPGPSWWTLNVEVGRPRDVLWLTVKAQFSVVTNGWICTMRARRPEDLRETKNGAISGYDTRFYSLQHIWILSYCARTKSTKIFWAQTVIPCKINANKNVFECLRHVKFEQFHVSPVSYLKSFSSLGKMFAFQKLGRDFWENTDSKLSVVVR